MANKKEMSKAFMRQVQNKKDLNDCLHTQRYYIELDIKDPSGKLVCEVSMSYDQFVRLLICQSDVTVTLSRYRNTTGELVVEEVEKPESVRDKVIDRMGDIDKSLKGRIGDLRKDLYELLNSKKAVGKVKLKELLDQIKTIEGHYGSNISYVTERAVEEITDIQENAKSQLSIFAGSLGADLKPGDFRSMIDSHSNLALPDRVSGDKLEDGYESKERDKKSIDNMTAMEVGDVLYKRLKVIEYFEDRQEIKEDHNKHLSWSSASGNGNKYVNICYISYQSTRKVELEVAKRYLKFLLSIKTLDEFKTHYWFEKEENE